MKKQIIKSLGMIGLATAMFVGLVGTVNAVDGVKLITQARAMSGNVTLGDLPGFPVTISQSGSYRLASNLNLGTSGVSTTAIEIKDTGKLTVKVDLNGFLIGGTNVCDFNEQGDVECTTTGTGNGIETSDESSVVITNGSIRGMGGNGINCLGSCTIEKLTIANNGGAGIRIPDSNMPSLVLQNKIAVNGSHGISTGKASIQSNVVKFNLGHGITTAFSTVVDK